MIAKTLLRKLGNALIHMSGGYEGAQASRRFKYWRPSNESINTLLQGGVEILRNRSRQMCRDNTYAANAINNFAANLTGTGIKPSSLIEDAALKKQIQDLWYDWVDEADADARTTFYGLQNVIARGLYEAGEIFVRFRPRMEKDGLTVPLQLQVLESEHLPMESVLVGNGNEVRLGIEFNAIGQRVAYHFYRKHPGDSTETRGIGEKVRIPASEVLHIFIPLRPGQLRGQPHMAAALAKLYVLDQYEDAELERKKVAALFAGFITKALPEDQVIPNTEDSGTDGIDLVGLEPATLQMLQPGEDIKFSEPADVGGNFESFMYRTLLAVSVGLGVPYTNLTGDLRQANYSSIRAGMLEFRRQMEQIQHDVMVYQFCRPVWFRWIVQAVLSRTLEVGYGEVQRLQRRVKWIPPKWPWVDPQKDIQAERIAVRAGFKSRSDVIDSEGYDPEEVDERIAQDNQRADALGLAFDSDARRTSNAGVGQDGRAYLPNEKDELTGDNEENNSDGVSGDNEEETEKNEEIKNAGE